MKSTSVVAVLLLFLAAGAALFLSRPKQTTATSPEELARVAEDVMRELQTEAGRSQAASLYQQNCASCHGEDRRGRAPAPSLISAELSGPSGAVRIMDAVMRGRKGMPALQGVLPIRDILQLVFWVRFTAVPDHGASAAVAAPPTKADQKAWSLPFEITLTSPPPSATSAVIFLMAKTRADFKGPPVLVKRFPAKQKIEGVLTASDAMMGTPPNAGDTLYLAARLSVSGNAIAEPSDLSSEIIPVQLEKKNLKLRLTIR